MKNYDWDFRAMKREGRIWKTIPQPMAIMQTLNSKQIEVYYEYVGFEDISTEDTIYANEKNNRQFTIVLVVYYKLRNKDNQRIGLRKEVKKAKTSITTYKKKK